MEVATFFGNEFTKCLRKLGIYHTVGTSYHHQTYGQGETSNKQTQEHIEQVCNYIGGKNWSKKFGVAQLA